MRDAKAILRTNGQNHKYNVENLELYTTPAIAVEKLLERETFSDSILEPACGIGSISDILINNGYNVISSDIVNRGYINQRYTEDFLSCNYHVDSRVDIITNPPYSLAEEFVRKSIDISTDGTKIAMLLKLTFLEGVKRRELFKKYPPKRVLVFSKRIRCNRGGVRVDRTISNMLCVVHMG